MKFKIEDKKIVIYSEDIHEFKQLVKIIQSIFYLTKRDTPKMKEKENGG